MYALYIKYFLEYIHFTLWEFKLICVFLWTKLLLYNYFSLFPVLNNIITQFIVFQCYLNSTLPNHPWSAPHLFICWFSVYEYFWMYLSLIQRTGPQHLCLLNLIFCKRFCLNFIFSHILEFLIIIIHYYKFLIYFF